MGREDSKAAAEVSLASDRLRRRANQAAPGRWRVRSDETGTSLVSREHEEMAIATGDWASGTAAYLALVSPNTAYQIAELLWLSESTIRQGRMPSRIQNALVTVAKEINACFASTATTLDPETA